MLTFYASPFAEGMVLLRSAAAEIAKIESNEEMDLQRGYLIAVLRKIKQQLDKLPLSRVLRSQFADLQGRADATLNFSDKQDIMTRLQLFYSNILTELDGHLFLMVEERRRELYDQNSPPFGSLVETVFSDAEYDIKAASRCLALEEWTASVFHLMRIVEHGLRDMAGRLSVPMAATADQENWSNIIDQIEKEIGRREKLPKGDPQRFDKDELQFYSSAASNFRHFKNAWRNTTFHARWASDQREAEEIHSHVKSFMLTLASDGMVGP